MWGIEHFLISNNVKNYYEGKKEKKKGASCLTKFSRFFFFFDETGFLVIVNVAKPLI